MGIMADQNPKWVILTQMLAYMKIASAARTAKSIQFARLRELSLSGAAGFFIEIIFQLIVVGGASRAPSLL